MKPLGIGSAGEIVTAWAFAARQIGADLDLKPVLFVNDFVTVAASLSHPGGSGRDGLLRIGMAETAAGCALTQGLDLPATIVAKDAPEAAAASGRPAVSYAPTFHCGRASPRRSDSY